MADDLAAYNHLAANAIIRQRRIRYPHRPARKSTAGTATDHLSCFWSSDFLRMNFG
jgi:hypothetical protein